VTVLRVVLGLLAAVVLIAQLVIGRPSSLAFAFICGLLMFVVAAGSVAADAIPLRTAALACSLATLACGLLLGLSGFLSTPTAVVALVALALQPAPAVLAKLRT
jgi:hypothetical protein